MSIKQTSDIQVSLRRSKNIRKYWFLNSSFIVSIFMLKIFDILTTQIGLTLNYVAEGNPLVLILLNNPFLFYFTSFMPIFALLSITYFSYSDDRKSILRLIVIFSIVWTIILYMTVINNINVINWSMNL